jgi:hypothetical protein
MAQVTVPDPAYYLNTRQRFDAYIFRTYTDPLKFGWLLIDSAQETWSKSPHEWDRSPESYTCRVASGWGRRVVRTPKRANCRFERFAHTINITTPTAQASTSKAGRTRPLMR